MDKKNDNENSDVFELLSHNLDSNLNKFSL